MKRRTVTTLAACGVFAAGAAVAVIAVTHSGSSPTVGASADGVALSMANPPAAALAGTPANAVVLLRTTRALRAVTVTLHRQHGPDIAAGLTAAPATSIPAGGNADVYVAAQPGLHVHGTATTELDVTACTAPTSTSAAAKPAASQPCPHAGQVHVQSVLSWTVLDPKTAPTPATLSTPIASRIRRNGNTVTVPDSVDVILASSVPSAQQDAVARRVATSSGGELMGKLAPADLYQIAFPSLSPAAVAARRGTLAASHEVRVAALEQSSAPLASADSTGQRTPNEYPKWPKPTSETWNWTLIGMQRAWAIRTNSTVPIGVLDYDIDRAHLDLAPNVVAHNDAIPYAPSREDRSHGTSVASLACGRGDNKIGVAGAAWKCPLRLWNFDQSEAPIHALSDIEALAQSGARVINLSFNFGWCSAKSLPDPQSQELFRFAAGGVLSTAAPPGSTPPLYVLSAGNDGCNADTDPLTALGSLPNVLVVGSVFGNGKFVFNSDYGAVVPIVAGGGWEKVSGSSHHGVYVAKSGPACTTTTGTTMVQVSEPSCATGYGTGTSFAAPQVTGLAALVASQRPDLDVDGVKSCIVDAAARAGRAVTTVANYGRKRGYYDEPFAKFAPGVPAPYIVDAPGALNCTELSLSGVAALPHSAAAGTNPLTCRRPAAGVELPGVLDPITCLDSVALDLDGNGRTDYVVLYTTDHRRGALAYLDDGSVHPLEGAGNTTAHSTAAWQSLGSADYALNAPFQLVQLTPSRRQQLVVAAREGAHGYAADLLAYTAAGHLVLSGDGTGHVAELVTADSFGCVTHARTRLFATTFVGTSLPANDTSNGAGLSSTFFTYREDADGALAPVGYVGAMSPTETGLPARPQVNTCGATVPDYPDPIGPAASTPQDAVHRLLIAAAGHDTAAAGPLLAGAFSDFSNPRTVQVWNELTGTTGLPLADLATAAVNCHPQGSQTTCTVAGPNALEFTLDGGPGQWLVSNLGLTTAATHAAVRRNGFVSPSGNIRCGLLDVYESKAGQPPDGMICFVTKHTYTPAQPCNFQPGYHAGVNATGPGYESFCAGDIGTDLDPAAQTFQPRYGTPVDMGIATCLATKADVTCRNKQSHGFTVSRTEHHVF